MMNEKLVNLLGINKKVILCRIEDRSKIKDVIMEPISKEEESRIDTFETFNIKPDNITINYKDIYIYGSLNLNDENDLDIIRKFDFTSSTFNSFVYTGFNYDKGTCVVKNNKLTTRPVTNPIEWFKYNHCLIGKPERIIIYKIKTKYGK